LGLSLDDELRERAQRLGGRGRGGGGGEGPPPPAAGPGPAGGGGRGWGGGERGARACRASPTKRPARACEASRPWMAGYVAFCCAWSLPAVLPSCSVVAVTSRMSSTIWNARPRSPPATDRAWSCAGVAPERRAPTRIDVRMRAAVLWRWM